MNKLDTNNNGYIDYTEFIAGCMKSKIYLKEDYLKNAFSFFDKVINQKLNGTLNRMEVALLLWKK
jgi:Ca2+-binding EF-hand superfamily protein